jgi:cysteine synthase
MRRSDVRGGILGDKISWHAETARRLVDSAGDALGYSSGAFSVGASAVFEALDFLQANLPCIAEA